MKVGDGLYHLIAGANADQYAAEMRGQLTSIPSDSGLSGIPMPRPVWPAHRTGHFAAGWASQVGRHDERSR